jgi:hypothetical protein
MKKFLSSIGILFVGFSFYGQLIISSNTTWTTNQTLTQPVKINPGATLTINPGVIVSILFIDNNSDLIGDVLIDVKGSLIVNGDACNKVQFKPYQVTSNKQYWSGINFDTISTNNSIKGSSITYAKNGIVIENTSLLANDVEISNCKSNGVYAFGSLANISLNNCVISNCDEEGVKISNSSNVQVKYLKSKNNGTTGIHLNSTTITIDNSVFYNNSKSGIYSLGSTLNLNNSISRKNARMGICLNNSVLTGNYLDIDSNSVDGIFIGGSSNVNLQNSSIIRNIGFGVETTEYIVNSDFGSIAFTNISPTVTINNSNFIKNQNTSVVLTTNDIPGMNSSPYGIGFVSNTAGTYCLALPDMCSAWSELCNNSINGLNPSPYSAWYNYQTFHVPFGRFENFVGSVSCNPNGGVSPTRYKCAYGIATQYDFQNPYWQWNPTPTSTFNPYSACYGMSGGGTVNSDKISFVSKYSGTDNPVVYSSIANSQSWSKFYVDYFSFRFGGFEFRSLINSTSSTNNLTGNFWDTISPTNVINSVGAVLNINGFVINEIINSHSTLSNSYIYGNLNYFELTQNNSVFCSGANNILIAPSGNYTYSWIVGTNTINNNNDSLQITTNGVYSVSITGLCNATSLPTSITLSTGTPITVTTSGPTTFCAGNSVTLTSPSSSGNLWSNGATTQSITVNTSGNYSLTVSNSQGCPSVSQTIQVNVTPLPSAPVISSTGNTTFCSNGSVTLSSNLSGNLIWSNSQTTQSIVVNSSGIYTAQITSNGCTSLPSNSIQVTVIPNPNNSVTASGPTTVCQGNPVTLNAVSSVGNTYQWYNNNVLIPNATNSSYTANSSGNYTVSILNGNCSSNSTGIIVTVNSIPAPPVISANGNTTFCQGNNVVLSSNLSNVIWSNSQSTQSITVSQSGNYTAQASSNGCLSTVSNSINVIVNTLPPTPIVNASGSTTFCAGGSVTLTSSSISNNLWSNNSNTQAITVNSSGSYSVTVTNSNGCSSSSIPLNVTVNQIPSAPVITPNGPTTFCSGGNVTLTSNSLTGNLWSNNSSSQAINVNSSGSYSATVTQNGCVSPSSNIITVTVNPTPSQPLITINGSTTFCSGESSILTSSSSNGNLWSTGQTSQSITVTNSGIYSVQVTSNGCSNSSTPITITANPSPSAPTIITNGPTTFCQGSNVTLTTDAPNGVVWTVSNGSQFPVATLIVQSNQSNIYATVTLNGCTSPPSQSVSTTVLPILTPFFTQLAAVCSGGIVNLPSASNNGISGTWSPAINNTATTTYTFTPSAGQCANTQTMSVAVNPLPTVTLATFNSVCDTAGIVSLTGGSPIGGIYSGTSVTNNAFNTTIGAGTYPITYSYTNNNGCSSTATQNLGVIDCSGSTILEIKESEIVLYPNPASKSFTLESIESNIGKLFEIQDVSGRIIVSGNLEAYKTQVIVSDFATGTYYLHVPELNKVITFIKQ